MLFISLVYVANFLCLGTCVHYAESAEDLPLLLDSSHMTLEILNMKHKNGKFVSILVSILILDKRFDSSTTLC